MSWELEFRKIKDGEWFVFTRGSLEECLEDALEFRHGGFHDYDATRLGFSRGDVAVAGEPEPEPRYPKKVLVDVRCPRCGELHPVDAELMAVEGDIGGGVTRVEYVGRAPVCPNTPIDINLVKLAAHQHVWHEDVAQALWVCVYKGVDCPARVTHDELHQVHLVNPDGGHADLLNFVWSRKVGKR